MRVIIIKAKDLFKSSVAIGAGLTVGKYLGDVINAEFKSIGLGIAIFGAKKATKVCKSFVISMKSSIKNQKTMIHQKTKFLVFMSSNQRGI